MTEYAIVDNEEFVAFRNFDEVPVLTGKPYRKFLPVVREYGEPFEGIENNQWVIRKVDPSTLPEPVPQSVSPRQARLALDAIGKLEEVEAAVAQADRSVRIAWEFSLEVRRDQLELVSIASELGFTDKDIDELFKAASKL